MASEDGTLRQKNCRQIIFWVKPLQKSALGIFSYFLPADNKYYLSNLWISQHVLARHPHLTSCFTSLKIYELTTDIPYMGSRHKVKCIVDEFLIRIEVELPDLIREISSGIIRRFAKLCKTTQT